METYTMISLQELKAALIIPTIVNTLLTFAVTTSTLTFHSPRNAS